MNLTANLIEDNTEVGIISYDSKNIRITENQILNTVSAGTILNSGHGIYVYAGSEKASVDRLGLHVLEDNTIKGSGGVGIGIDSLSYGDTAENLFEMYNNTIAGSAFVGINLQNTHTGIMTDNSLDDNTGYGLRCMDGPGSASRVFFDANRVNGTTTSMMGDDGDGVLMSNCHVSVDFNLITANDRYGVYFSNNTSGGCENNKIEDHDWDIVDDGNGMSIFNNTINTLTSNTLTTNLAPVSAPAL